MSSFSIFQKFEEIEQEGRAIRLPHVGEKLGTSPFSELKKKRNFS